MQWQADGELAVQSLLQSPGAKSRSRHVETSIHVLQLASVEAHFGYVDSMPAILKRPREKEREFPTPLASGQRAFVAHWMAFCTKRHCQTELKLHGLACDFSLKCNADWVCHGVPCASCCHQNSIGLTSAILSFKLYTASAKSTKRWVGLSHHVVHALLHRQRGRKHTYPGMINQSSQQQTKEISCLLLSPGHAQQESDPETSARKGNKNATQKLF